MFLQISDELFIFPFVNLKIKHEYSSAVLYIAVRQGFWTMTQSNDDDAENNRVERKSFENFRKRMAALKMFI
jgi:hypothetical protein